MPTLIVAAVDSICKKLKEIMKQAERSPPFYSQ